MSKTVFKDKFDFINSYFTESDTVLDVGCFGQGIDSKSSKWVHGIICSKVSSCLGIDLHPDVLSLNQQGFDVQCANAETFYVDQKFSKIYGGDIIEHLSNPGLFLTNMHKMLSKDGELTLGTPNPFSFFTLAESIFRKGDPTVNKEHTCYFSSKTFSELVSRHGFTIHKTCYLEYLGVSYKESLFKKILNTFYPLFTMIDNSFYDNYVFILKKK